MELEWSLINEHGYTDGDTFTFQLPKQLKVYSVFTGSLGDYGTFVVALNGEVTITLNEKIEGNSNVVGTFWFDTKLNQEEITSSTGVIEIKYNDVVVKTVTVNIKPTGGQAIHKEGQPVGGNFNAEEIQWTVLFNTIRDSLVNAILNDPIQAGQNLDVGSIELYEVEVNLVGNVVQELDAVATTDFTNTSTAENLNLALGDTNKAYKLKFKKMLEDEKDKEGATTYKNTAFLNSTGKDEKILVHLYR